MASPTFDPEVDDLFKEGDDAEVEALFEDTPADMDDAQLMFPTQTVNTSSQMMSTQAFENNLMESRQFSFAQGSENTSLPQVDDAALMEDLFGESDAGKGSQLGDNILEMDDLADDDDIFGDGVPTPMDSDGMMPGFDDPNVDPEISVDDEPRGPQPEISDLFGDDFEGSENVNEENAIGKKGVKRENVRVKEEPGASGNETVNLSEDINDDPAAGLFGDDGDEEFAMSLNQTNIIDEDEEEKDLFGELSDDASEERDVEEYYVRKRLLPDGDVFLFRIPNTLALEENPYNPNDMKASIGFRDRQNFQHNNIVGLDGPENTMRWRFKENPSTGEKERDENGDLVFESNSQFVEFEDGSVMLRVGDEYYTCQDRKEGRTHLFVEEENDLYVFHKELAKTMQAIPSSINSESHRRLLSAQIDKVRSHRIVKPISTQQAKKLTEHHDREFEEARMREIRQKDANSRRRTMGAGRQMDASYLEGDDMAEGPSLKFLKRNNGGAFLQRTSDTLN